jgi:hypothetical protein
MVETTEWTATEYDMAEEQKPIIMDFNAKLASQNCGILGIHEIKDKDCKAIIRRKYKQHS